MKYRILFLLFFFNALTTVLLAQNDKKEEGGTQDANKGNKDIIEFSFEVVDGKIKGFQEPLPFDRRISILFTHIRPTANKITVTLYEFREKKNPVKLQLPHVEEWTRTSKDETSAMVTLTDKFKPNTDYDIDIKIGTLRPLTDDEKDIVRTALQDDINVQNSINELAYGYIDMIMTDPRTVSYYNLLVDHKDEIVRNITTAIKAVDTSYELKEPDPMVIIEEVSGFTNSILNVFNVILNGEDNINKMANDSASKSQAKDFIEKTVDLKTKFRQLNWAGLTSLGNGIYSDQINTVDLNDIVSSFDLLTGFDSTQLSPIKQSFIRIDRLLNDAITAKEALKESIINELVLRSLYLFSALNKTYPANFVEMSKLYITLDVGVAYAARMDRVLTYSGVNVYFRPINKSIPLSHYKGLQALAVRTSLLIGITMNSVNKDNVRKGLIDDKALVTGFGFRIVPFLKLNAGTLIHYRYDNNPLLTSDRYYTSFSPFVSLSLDIDVKSLFEGVGTAIFK